MTEQEINPIPAHSVVTENMIVAYMEHFKVDRAGALGSLLAWEDGKGELDSRLVDLDISTGSTLFTPIREAYYAKQGISQPALSLTTDEATPAELEQIAEDHVAVEEVEVKEEVTEEVAPETEA